MTRLNNKDNAAEVFILAQPLTTPVAAPFLPATDLTTSPLANRYIHWLTSLSLPATYLICYYARTPPLYRVWMRSAFLSHTPIQIGCLSHRLGVNRSVLL